MAGNRFSRILLRGGTKQELENINPMLKEREPIVEYDTGRMKIGDGINRYNKLKYVGGASNGTPTITSFVVTKCVTSNGKEFNNVVPNGATIKDVTLSYVVSSIPDEITISDANNIYFTETNPESLSKTIDITDKEITSDTSYNLNMKYNDSSINQTANIIFKPYLYYMVSNYNMQDYIDKSVDYSRLSNNVSKELITSRSNTLPNIDSGNDKYIYIFLPKAIYGSTVPTFKVGDFTGGFIQLASEDIDSFSTTNVTKITNDYNASDDYYVFRSTNSGLGIKTITIS